MEADRRHQNFLAEKFFASLDGLRGVSIAAVVWHHVAGHQTGLLGRGHLGVQLFFAISGFLITTLLLREHDRAGVISLRNFYVRRTLRIFPAYFATVLLYVIVVAAFEPGSPAGTQFWKNLPFYLTYTSNWFVDIASGPRVIFYFAWSLATEEQFYLMWPWAVRFARRWYQPVLVMIGLLAVGEIARAGSPVHGMLTQPLPIRILGSIASPICLGCLLAYLLHRPFGYRAAFFVAGRNWSAPLASALLLVSVAIEGMPMLVISLAMTYLVATVVIRPDHSMRAAFDGKVLTYVGKISYGIYLYHMLAINAARRFVVPSRDPILVFLVALPLAVGIATLSYRYFELPFQRLKHRFEVRPVTVTSQPSQDSVAPAPLN